MTVIITPRELMDRDKWEDYCRLSGTSVYAVKEGLLSSREEIRLPEAEARALRLVKTEEEIW